ncbi:putative hydrolase of the HAD superfamily [Paenibacillus phyllosphaerae]|uniref:Phosphoserine phosphatase n=1 Tax=Paenibacillus phyllosphaerae TaxID=274593 RepID=A0A7W5AX92_9BACL|nr:HAD family hydrolase [Paenibacillus phyllosphaerae]MBB3110362.1 putative hydrolase of the HAD superfamily [Paenibacillus phyllosphaerae]
MAKKAVLFDLDDTLLWDDRSVQEAFDATCEAAAAKTGIDAKKLEEAVRHEARELYASYETFPFTKMIGINPFEGLWANFKEGEQEEFRKLEALAPNYRREAWTRGLKALGVDDPALGQELAEQFPAERRKRPYVYEETFEVLKKLKGNYKLLLLTNGSPDLQQEKLDGVPDLAPYFDHIIISGTFGQGKPAAPIFKHALERLGIEPEDGIMVGDKLTTDILGSNTIGMTSVWINRHGATRTDEIIPSHEIKHLEELLPLLV